MSYRFLPDVVYEITAFALNGTELDTKTVNLSSNNEIVSFGFYSTEVPIVPVPQFVEVITQRSLVLIFGFIFGIVAIIVYYRLQKEKMKKDRRNPNGYNSSISKSKTPYY